MKSFPDVLKTRLFLHKWCFNAEYGINHQALNNLKTSPVGKTEI
jgi:hypothetical protein